VSWRSSTKRTGSGSVPKCHGSGTLVGVAGSFCEALKAIFFRLTHFYFCVLRTLPGVLVQDVKIHNPGQKPAQLGRPIYQSNLPSLSLSFSCSFAHQILSDAYRTWIRTRIRLFNPIQKLWPGFLSKNRRSEFCPKIWYKIPHFWLLYVYDQKNFLPCVLSLYNAHSSVNKRHVCRLHVK